MGNSIVELNTDNFAENISKGTVLVDFWAPWCMPCLMQSPILETIAQTIGNNAVIAKANVENFPALAELYEVEGIPTLLLFDNGKVMKRFTGLQSERILRNALQEVTGAVPVNNADIFA